jgi:hypothetical protein
VFGDALQPVAVREAHRLAELRERGPGPGEVPVRGSCIALASCDLGEHHSDPSRGPEHAGTMPYRLDLVEATPGGVEVAGAKRHDTEVEQRPALPETVLDPVEQLQCLPQVPMCLVHVALGAGQETESAQRHPGRSPVGLLRPELQALLEPAPCGLVISGEPVQVAQQVAGERHAVPPSVGGESVGTVLGARDGSVQFTGGARCPRLAVPQVGGGQVCVEAVSHDERLFEDQS